MLLRLILAFTIIPLVELYLLLRLADATSAGLTFAIVILTGIVGSLLARREGAAAWRRLHGALGQNRMPSKEIQDGVMIVFAAALLLTPGLLTDAFGFLMLIPPGRALVRTLILPRFFRGFRFQVATFGSPENQSSETGVDPQPETFRPSRRMDGKTIDATDYQRRPTG